MPCRHGKSKAFAAQLDVDSGDGENLTLQVRVDVYRPPLGNVHSMADRLRRLLTAGVAVLLGVGLAVAPAAAQTDDFPRNCGGPSRPGMSRALLKLSGSLVHDYATISDDSPSPNRASRARRAATSAGIS